VCFLAYVCASNLKRIVLVLLEGNCSATNQLAAVLPHLQGLLVCTLLLYNCWLAV
jgi:hypothetical protein